MIDWWAVVGVVALAWVSSVTVHAIADELWDRWTH